MSFVRKPKSPRAILFALLLASLASQNAQAQAGPIGSQFQFDGLFQLVFILGFMVVIFTILGVVFGAIGSALGWVGGKAQASIDEMARRQREKEAVERARTDRLNRLFPTNKSPPVDWNEIQDELITTPASIGELWQEHRDHKHNGLTQAKFEQNYAAWLLDANAQMASLERAKRDWSEQRRKKEAQAYTRLLAALKKSGATDDWINYVRKISADAERDQEGTLAALAVTSIEDALSALTLASHPHVWVELQCLLARRLAHNAKDRASKYDDPAMLERAAKAYRLAYDQISAANSKVTHGALDIMQLRLDYAHVLKRLGQSGNATAAATAEKLLTATVSNFPAGVSAHTMANVMLNLAMAAETQGDCAQGAARSAHYLRARTLYQSALLFWEESKLDKLARAQKNLTRLEGKLRQS